MQRIKVRAFGVAARIGIFLRRPSAFYLVHRAQRQAFRLARRMFRRFRRAFDRVDCLLVVAARPLTVAVDARVGVLHDLFPHVELALLRRHADITVRQRLIAALIDFVDAAPVRAAAHRLHEGAHVFFFCDEVPDLVLADLRRRALLTVHAQHHFAALAVDDAAHADRPILGLDLQKARHHRHALHALAACPVRKAAQLVVPVFLWQHVQRLVARAALHAQCRRTRERLLPCDLSAPLRQLSVSAPPFRCRAA